MASIAKAVEQTLKSGLVRFQAFVNGAWIDAKDRRTFSVTNPADGSHLGDVPDMTTDDARSAIDAAYEAKREWAKRTSKASKRNATQRGVFYVFFFSYVRRSVAGFFVDGLISFDEIATIWLESLLQNKRVEFVATTSIFLTKISLGKAAERSERRSRLRRLVYRMVLGGGETRLRRRSSLGVDVEATFRSQGTGWGRSTHYSRKRDFGERKKGPHV